MWNSVIHTELYYFRIDHDKLYFIRICLVQDTDDKCIDTYWFTWTGCTCDEKMWHFGNIRNYSLTCNILSYCKRKFGFCLLKFFWLEQISEHNRTVLFIGNLNAHCCFAGDRCFNTDIRSGKIQFDVICKTYNFADLHSHLGLKFITGNSWSAAHISDSHVHAEIVKYFLEFFCSLTQIGIRIPLSFAASFLQQI